LGPVRLPGRLVGLVESSPKGRAYPLKLAGQLFAVYHRVCEAPGQQPRRTNGCS
jgi:hypothetical protein